MYSNSIYISSFMNYCQHQCIQIYFSQVIVRNLQHTHIDAKIWRNDHFLYPVWERTV